MQGKWDIPFMLGCNYWASKNGTEMWKDFDPVSIEEDFNALAQNGTQVLRVFPNWRDFQPITTIDGYQGSFTAYRMDDGSADGADLPNEYGLSVVMLERFAVMCDLAEKYGLKLIVSLLTGWMSGRLFAPNAFKNKNVLTDFDALRWEYRFAKGFVEALKDKSAIIAWDLGNECNCMGQANEHQAFVWTMTIVSGIKAADLSRPILSGMHSLAVCREKPWTMRDQGELTDLLTTHPYPGSAEIGADLDPVDSYRTLLLPTAQTVLYADISGKPAMIEEQGTLNNVYANRDMAAHAERVNMVTSWAHGSKGYLWWCAFDQKKLNFFPYELSMRELGWLDEQRNPKPVAKAMKNFGQVLETLPIKDFDRCETDAVCVLTQGQDNWPVAAMTFLLGLQSGMAVRFAYQDMPLPQAPIYLLPSMKGWTPIYKKTYYEILRRVHDEGATLLLTWDGGAIELFEEVFQLRSDGQYQHRGSQQGVFDFVTGQKTISFNAPTTGIQPESNGAQVLGQSDGKPVFTKAAYGKGVVFFLSFGLERMLWDVPMAFDGGSPWNELYRTVYASSNAVRDIICENPELILVRAHKDGKRYAILINPTVHMQKKCLHGSVNIIPLQEERDDMLAAGEFAVYELK